MKTYENPAVRKVMSAGDMRVIVYRDEGHWYAQGLEVDYLAQGSDPWEAVTNFVTGFTGTIRENVRIGSLEKVFVAAPLSVWSEHLGTGWYRYVMMHRTMLKHNENATSDLDVLPFSGIQFLVVPQQGVMM